MLTVCTYAWGTKYGIEHIDRLRRGVARNFNQPHRFVVISDDGRCVDDAEAWRIPDEDLNLTLIPGCFARLRLFDPEYLAAHDVDRIACIDLDGVITGGLDEVFDRTEPFVIFQGANVANPCPYNGSTWMLRRGYRPDVWTGFNMERAMRVPFYKFPEDQAWFAHKLPGAAGWRAGRASGLYGFGKPGWPKGDALPEGARIVTFVGDRDPSKFLHLEWIRKHWVA